jgi:putative flippase GtrA
MRSLPVPWQRFLRYVFSGGLATCSDIGLYLVLLSFGVYFVMASVFSGVLAFFAAFFLHKYVTYQESGDTTEHFIRYCILTALNFLAQNIILYVAVMHMGISEGWAKVMASASAILWNFFLYKRFVYRTKKKS